MEDFDIKPFIKGVLKDIPSQLMPTGGLTDGNGIVVKDGYISKRLGFSVLNKHKNSEYILGIYQFKDRNGIDYLFFGDRYYLYKIQFSVKRSWDDGYPWWDVPGFTWDALESGSIYRLSPYGQKVIYPSQSSSSWYSESSESESGSEVDDVFPFTGYYRKDLYSETSRWFFMSWGNNIIATNYENPIQLISGPLFRCTGNLTGDGLRARFVCEFKNHIIALNVVDSIDGAIANRMVWSDLDSATFDFANPASEAGYIDLPESQLPITGGAKLGDTLLVFQPNMIHAFNYTGGSLVYKRSTINYEIGALDFGLVCSSGNNVFFFSKDDIYKFDGYNLTSIGEGNNKYIFDGLNLSQVSRSFSYFDINTNEIHFVIPHNEVYPNLDCIYNVNENIWTFDNVDASAGCGKNGLEYPTIARINFELSSSFSSSSESDSSSSESFSSSSESSSSTSFSSESFSSSSESVSSFSQSSSSSSLSISAEPVDASGFIMYVGSGDNDENWERKSEWVTGEYTFPDIDSNGYSRNSNMIKEIIDLIPIIQELDSSIDIYIGTRNKVKENITWHNIATFDTQDLLGVRKSGVFISFKFVSTGKNNYYKISELVGHYKKKGNR